MKSEKRLVLSLRRVGESKGDFILLEPHVVEGLE